MSKVSTIFVALAACVVLAGVAAAESPDAGSTWSTAKNFNVGDGYNYVGGQLKADPVDQIDVWKSNDGTVNDYIELYLDGTAYGHFVKAQLRDNENPKDLMQQVYKGGGGPQHPDTSLDTSVFYVNITGNRLLDEDYTFCIYLN
jgi:hypothetical protein